MKSTNGAAVDGDNNGRMVLSTGGTIMLTVYTLEQAKQWDDTVRTFKHYDTYWLSGYVTAFKIHGDGEPILFYFEDKNTRGINVVMKRDIAADDRFQGKLEKGKYFDFATPYGYGGWIIEGEDVASLFKAYEKWCADNNIISEFVRFHPIIKNHEKCNSFYEVICLGEVVHMELDSAETIWSNITSKNRNMIRKAVKSDVKIYNGRYPDIYRKFRDIYNSTMDKNEAEKYYYFSENFYESILEDLPENAQVFFAEKDGKVIAASIILMANGKMNYHLSGSLREYGGLAPTNLILYKAACWGSANGYRTFYLGGGVGSGEDSLFKFKRSFYRGELNHFYIGKRIYAQDVYDVLLRIRINEDSNVLESEYFPQYRSTI